MLVIAFVASLFVVVCCWLCLVYCVFVAMLSGFVLRSGSAHCDLALVVEVRQCPLRSGACEEEEQEPEGGEELIKSNKPLLGRWGIN